MERAKRHYEEQAGCPPVGVMVFFVNEWSRKTDPDKMAKELVTIVRHQCPRKPGEAVTLGRDELDAETGFSQVRIAHGQGDWYAGGNSNIPMLQREHLAACIAAKNSLVPEYRERLPGGWQVWLLIGTEVLVLHSVSIPEEITEWRFAFDLPSREAHSEHGCDERVSAGLKRF